jgi:hypothetical protein
MREEYPSRAKTKTFVSLTHRVMGSAPALDSLWADQQLHGCLVAAFGSQVGSSGDVMGLLPGVSASEVGVGFNYTC